MSDPKSLGITFAPSIVERVDVGVWLARRTIAGKPTHQPIGMQMRALAQGVFAWRDLVEGVLAGDTEALDMARKAIARHPWPKQPNEGGTKK